MEYPPEFIDAITQQEPHPTELDALLRDNMFDLS